MAPAGTRIEGPHELALVDQEQAPRLVDQPFRRRRRALQPAVHLGALVVVEVELLSLHAAQPLQALLLHRIGPRRNHLRLERFNAFGEVHFLPDDPLQVILEVELVDQGQLPVGEQMDDQGSPVAHASGLDGITARVARILHLDRAVLVRNQGDGILAEELVPDRQRLARLHLDPGELAPFGQRLAPAPHLVGAVDRDSDDGVAQAAAQADLDQRRRVDLAHVHPVLDGAAGGAGVDEEGEPDGEGDDGEMKQRIAQHGPLSLL